MIVRKISLGTWVKIKVFDTLIFIIYPLNLHPHCTRVVIDVDIINIINILTLVTFGLIIRFTGFQVAHYFVDHVTQPLTSYPEIFFQPVIKLTFPD